MTCGKVRFVRPSLASAKHCSRRCARVADRASDRSRICIGCGAQFTARRHDAVYCTKLCGIRCTAKLRARANKAIKRRELAARFWKSRVRLSNQQLVDRKQLKRYGPIRARQCTVCSATFLPTHRAKLICSATCERKASKGRRSAMFGKRSNRVKIFERDRWLCSCCGVSTPQALMGSNDPTAPELDHWVPVSFGGPDVEWNAHTLCRTCNAIKRDILIAVPTGFLRRLGVESYRLLVDCWLRRSANAGTERHQRSMRVHAQLRERYAYVYEGRHNPWPVPRGVVVQNCGASAPRARAYRNFRRRTFESRGVL